MINEEETVKIPQTTNDSKSEKVADVGLAEIMEMVTKGITPPGIEVYDDMPNSSEKIEHSKSVIDKKQKPWLAKESNHNVFEITPDQEREPQTESNLETNDEEVKTPLNENINTNN